MLHKEAWNIFSRLLNGQLRTQRHFNVPTTLKQRCLDVPTTLKQRVYREEE